MQHAWSGSLPRTLAGSPPMRPVAPRAGSRTRCRTRRARRRRTSSRSCACPAASSATPPCAARRPWRRRPASRAASSPSAPSTRSPRSRTRSSTCAPLARLSPLSPLAPFPPCALAPLPPCEPLGHPPLAPCLQLPALWTCTSERARKRARWAGCSQTWAAILAAVPRSRLILKNKPFACVETRAAWLRRFAVRGVELWRVELLPLTAGTGEHLAQYGLMDISLDPWPYAGAPLARPAGLAGGNGTSAPSRAHSAYNARNVTRAELVLRPALEHSAGRGSGAVRQGSSWIAGERPGHTQR